MCMCMRFVCVRGGPSNLALAPRPSTIYCARGSIFFNWYSGGMESNWVHSALRPPMAYCDSAGWLRWCRNRWNDWQGKPKYLEKTCPSAALSTTNLTCCPETNPGRRGGEPASNRLSYGTAKCTRLTLWMWIHTFNSLIGSMIRG
jgi:hypothetical protein